jgi:hypothetical protein
MKLLKSLLFLKIVLFSIGTSQADDIIGECQHIVKNLCGDKDVTACTQSHPMNSKLETCLGILLTEDDVPNAVKSMQVKHLFDASVSGCFTVYNQFCGGLDIDFCVEKYGSFFTENCRVLFYELEAQDKKFNELKSHCYNSVYNTCRQDYPVSMASYTAFNKSVSAVENCLSTRLLKREPCVADIRKDAKQRAKEKAEAEAKAKAEAEAKEKAEAEAKAKAEAEAKAKAEEVKKSEEEEE